MDLSDTPFRIETEKVATKTGCWNHLKVSIYQLDGEARRLIGSYEREYTVLFNTFVPFQKNGKWYALYSSDYTATRVMSLPECTDLGGEEGDAFGFCPVGYFVPDEVDMNDDPNTSLGIVIGCIWGDDSSWKIQLLDLRDVENGNIQRIPNTLGYLEYGGSAAEMVNDITLEQIKPGLFFLRFPSLKSIWLELPQKGDPIYLAKDGIFKFVVYKIDGSSILYLTEDGTWECYNQSDKDYMKFPTSEKAEVYLRRNYQKGSFSIERMAWQPAGMIREVEI